MHRCGGGSSQPDRGPISSGAHAAGSAHRDASESASRHREPLGWHAIRQRRVPPRGKPPLLPGNKPASPMEPCAEALQGSGSPPHPSAAAASSAKARALLVFLFALQLPVHPLLEPLPEPRDRRQGDQHLQRRDLPLQLLRRLLDEEVAELHAPEARLGARDGVEDRRGHSRTAVGALAIARAALGPSARYAWRLVLLLGGEQHVRHPRSDRVREGRVKEDERLLGHARVEEGKQALAAPEPPAEVAPAADAVHGLAGDDLLEQSRRGGLPRDALQPHDPGAEPVGQERPQALAHRPDGRGGGGGPARLLQHVLPHPDQELYPFGLLSDASEQRDIGRLAGVLKQLCAAKGSLARV
eukprot:CAMPEP_0177603930 /NCGR_PEP_ID=MMETSP0419_2-20121207/15811_1 /TAXON_ID=582737 /ORGANISM="Tetraselmis sp., Strain GSL018" /LENGTH=355 /DNA_ID=CAMNT_0019097807 /DNA_START=650 /DNA_END=1718 /DNA_ORIENTATION=+